MESAPRTTAIFVIYRDRPQFALKMFSLFAKKKTTQEPLAGVYVRCVCWSPKSHLQKESHIHIHMTQTSFSQSIGLLTYYAERKQNRAASPCCIAEIRNTNMAIS